MPINEVHTHKHLGVFLSSDCQWHDHLDYIKSKAWSRINVMRKFKFKLDRKSLQTMYFSFIRPLLEYAEVIWDNCTQYEVNQLVKIQNEAARVVTGGTKLVSINSLYSETGWEPLASRQKKHKLLVFYNMVNNLSPAYLSSLVPSTVGNTTTYQLCNVANLHSILLIHNFTIIPFYPLLSEIGMSCQTMCATHLAKWYLNIILTVTLLTHPFFSLLVNAWDRSTTHD